MAMRREPTIPAPGANHHRQATGKSTAVARQENVSLLVTFCDIFRRPVAGLLGALQVEGEQFGQEFIIAERRRPAVGGEDGGVELLVGEVEPGGALVVEVGESPLFEFLGALFVFGNEAGVADGAGSSPISP